MAALTITASQVVAGTTNADFFTALSAENITAGQVCYLNASNLLALADANASATTATVKGIAVHGSLAGQKLIVQTGGDLTLGAGAAPAVGTPYFLGATAGAINPAGDLATGWYTSFLGVGKTGNILSMPPAGVFNSGQIVP